MFNGLIINSPNRHSLKFNVLKLKGSSPEQVTALRLAIKWCGLLFFGLLLINGLFQGRLKQVISLSLKGMQISYQNTTGLRFVTNRQKQIM